MMPAKRKKSKDATGSRADEARQGNRDKQPAQVYAVRSLIANDGSDPFGEWLGKLRDVSAIGRIQIRLDRMEEGNFGDHRSIGDGVFELRIDYGPGYRVYYALDGLTVIVVLLGGDKKSQDNDASLARAYWKDYKKCN